MARGNRRASGRRGRLIALALLAVLVAVLPVVVAPSRAPSSAERTASAVALRNAIGGPGWRATFGDQVLAAIARTPQLTLGMDVSAHQRTVDWQADWDAGARFAYVKATEGTTYTSRTFAAQYSGAAAVGMFHGAYHFARPDASSGAVQARYFMHHGGRWTDDGATLPPLLDIETDYRGGDMCWGKSPASMVRWIKDFSRTVYRQSGIRPVIYTTKTWWNTCTGASDAFSSGHLFVADPAVTDFAEALSVPSGWPSWSLWQWAYGSGPFDGDSDALAPGISLREFALGRE